MRRNIRPSGKLLPGGLAIIHEDRDILVVDKPPGLLIISTDREKSRRLNDSLNSSVSPRHRLPATNERNQGKIRGLRNGEITMKKILGFAAVVLSLSAFAFADESGLVDKNSGIVTKLSKHSVSETMDRVEAAAKGVGANIFARIDYQEMSKKVKVDIRPNQLLIFGRGAAGPYLIKEAPLAAIDIPFKALVWEDSQGKVWLNYTNGSFIDKRYTVKGAQSYVKNVDEVIEKIVSEALK